MKQLLLFGALIFTFNSFGQQKLDICGCLQISLTMVKEMEESGYDEEKMKEIAEKYQPEVEACTKKADESAKEMENMSRKERKKVTRKLETELENCDAYHELIKMIGEV